MDILRFPADLHRCATTGASKWQIIRARIAIAFGKLLTSLRLPGSVRDTEIVDDVSGQRISIQTGPLFTRLSINGRDYYFRRLSGRFDGTGTGCSR